ncbi:MAG: hypothetical protein J5I41_09165 [Saprospiraceae bacterium]|nr:hypothetical protein [Saprospiraceae bacterium]
MSHPAPEAMLTPENALERSLLAHPEFRQGLYWGIPRTGHPEGPVLYHIREVLDNIDAMVLPADDRRLLRWVAYAHDTFKYREEALRLRQVRIHHGQIAADFLSGFSVPATLIQLVHWHDEAYYAWRMHRRGEGAAATGRLHRLYDRLRPVWDLFLSFFQADTLTGDKNPEPLRWLAEQRVHAARVLEENRQNA